MEEVQSFHGTLVNKRIIVKIADNTIVKKNDVGIGLVTCVVFVSP